MFKEKHPELHVTAEYAIRLDEAHWPPGLEDLSWTGEIPLPSLRYDEADLIERKNAESEDDSGPDATTHDELFLRHLE
jgi:hypothetical protein